MPASVVIVGGGLMGLSTAWQLCRAEPGSRVTLNGDVTTEPDTGEFHRDDLDRNYSTTKEWLTEFRDFCRNCPQGFQVS